jgi:hypothetical protein
MSCLIISTKAGALIRSLESKYGNDFPIVAASSSNICITIAGAAPPLPSVAELDRFFADTPLPVSVTDRSHCFVYANEAFCRCLREFAQSITEARRSI